MDKISNVIKRRSSTRGYAKEPLTNEEIEALLQAGLMAPTATNKQEIHFTVLDGNHPVLAEIEDEKNRLRGLNSPEHNFYYEAPTVIILSADSAFRWSQVDAGIAVENMSLTAEGLGLGSLIIGCVYDALHGEKKEYFSKKLQFPPNYEFEIALAAGHKAVEKEPHTFEKGKQVTYLK